MVRKVAYLALVGLSIGAICLVAACGSDDPPAGPAEPETGTVAVDPSPDALPAPWTLAGPDGYSGSGTGGTSLGDVPVGSYTLTWGDVDGWATPPAETLILDADATVSFNGVYLEESGFGTIVMDPSPDLLNAPWTVTGPDSFSESGNGDQTLTDVPAGYYMVTWGGVTDWITPPVRTLAVAADATVTFDGTYVPEPGVGTVVVDPDPNSLNAPWTLTGPDGYQETGSGDQILNELTEGSYRVAWGAVSGWTAPAAETMVLAEDQTVTFSGTYEESVGPGIIVVDHNAVLDFDAGNIPVEWIEEVKNQGILIHIPGRSHAQQFVGDLDGDPITHVGGLKTLEGSDPTYAVAIQCDLADLPADGALRILKGQYSPQTGGLMVTWECRFDGTQYWTGENGRLITEFTATYAADAGDPIDASIFGWSYDIIKPDWIQDESGEMTMFDDERLAAYLNATARFNTHPSGTNFIYATTPTDQFYSPNNAYLTTDGLRVTNYNQDFRDGAAAAGGILFDQAEIENWNSSFTARRTESYQGQALQLRHSDWDGSDCAHGGMGVCVAKAKAIWWLAARLAGWDGTPAAP